MAKVVKLTMTVFVGDDEVEVVKGELEDWFAGSSACLEGMEFETDTVDPVDVSERFRTLLKDGPR